MNETQERESHWNLVTEIGARVREEPSVTQRFSTEWLGNHGSAEKNSKLSRRVIFLLPHQSKIWSQEWENKYPGTVGGRDRSSGKKAGLEFGQLFYQLSIFSYKQNDLYSSQSCYRWSN